MCHQIIGTLLGFKKFLEKQVSNKNQVKFIDYLIDHSIIQYHLRKKKSQTYSVLKKYSY